MTPALHAEWTKLRTLAGSWWLLAAAAAFCVAVSAAAAAAARCQSGRCGSGPPDPARISLTGVYLAQVLVALFAVAMIGGEYGTGMIRVTLAATPRRLTLFAAKAAVVAGWALLAGLAAVGGALLAGWLILPGTLRLGREADLRAAFGSVLYLVLIALLALGVATAVRDTAVGIGVVLGLLFLFPLASSVVPDQVLARHLEQVAPMTAGLYIQVTVSVQSLPLSPWRGLGVTALWALGALLLGGFLLRLRDA